MRTLSAVALVMIVVSGCQYDGQYGHPPRMVSVRVDLDFPAAVGRRPVSRTVEVPYGSTVLDATMLAVPDLNGRRHDGTAQGTHVQQIRYLRDNEPGKRGGWNYTVNGGHPSPGPGGMPVADGDVVRWSYNAL